MNLFKIGLMGLALSVSTIALATGSQPPKRDPSKTLVLTVNSNAELQLRSASVLFQTHHESNACGHYESVDCGPFPKWSCPDRFVADSEYEHFLPNDSTNPQHIAIEEGARVGGSCRWSNRYTSLNIESSVRTVDGKTAPVSNRNRFSQSVFIRKAEAGETAIRSISCVYSDDQSSADSYWFLYCCPTDPIIASGANCDLHKLTTGRDAFPVDTTLPIDLRFEGMM